MRTLFGGLEASKVAGHASTRITEEYTVVAMQRQDELTRRIQGKLEKAMKRKKQKEKVVPIRNEEAVAVAESR